MTRKFNMIIIALSFCISSARSNQVVPALFWSPERSMSDISDVSGVNPVNSNDFLNTYLAPLMGSSSESAVVFLQDKLHMDDFTKFADVYSLDSDGGAFKNIKNLMEEHFSLELPQVSEPHVAVEKLQSSFSGDVHKVTSSEDVESLGLTTDKKFLLIVQLKPVTGQENQENVLQQNDAIIGAVSRHLQKRSIKYTALFTGESAAEEPQIAAADSRISRHLMAEAEDKSNGTFMNVTHAGVFIYMREIFLCVKNISDTEISYCHPNFTLVLDESTADHTNKTNETAIIEFAFTQAATNSTDMYDIRIKTDVRSMVDRWVMERMYLDVIPKSSSPLDGPQENVTLSKGQMDWVIPILYSWHCSDMKVYVDDLHDKEHADLKGSYVQIKGYQLQPFMIQNNRFFNAQDCVGFFTIPIWMALFCSAVLLAILLFGTLMVLNLSIMDKYDDPKGKTITVAQASD